MNNNLALFFGSVVGVIVAVVCLFKAPREMVNGERRQFWRRLTFFALLELTIGVVVLLSGLWYQTINQDLFLFPAGMFVSNAVVLLFSSGLSYALLQY